MIHALWINCHTEDDSKRSKYLVNCHSDLEKSLNAQANARLYFAGEKQDKSDHQLNGENDKDWKWIVECQSLMSSLSHFHSEINLAAGDKLIEKKEDPKHSQRLSPSAYSIIFMELY